LIGVFCGFDSNDEALIDFPGNENRQPISAISAVPLHELARGREVVLLFEEGDERQPIIVGICQISADKTANDSDAVVVKAEPQPHGSFIGAVMGTVSGFSGHMPLVDFDDNPNRAPVCARICVPAKSLRTGTTVVLNFEKANAARPIVVGVLEDLERQAAPAFDAATQASVARNDDQQLIFEAQAEIVFRCGNASITLTRTGKVLIKGDYIISRSSGVNCIKGGSVRIN